MGGEFWRGGRYELGTGGSAVASKMQERVEIMAKSCEMIAMSCTRLLGREQLGGNRLIKLLCECKCVGRCVGNCRWSTGDWLRQMVTNQFN